MKVPAAHTRERPGHLCLDRVTLDLRFQKGLLKSLTLGQHSPTQGAAGLPGTGCSWEGHRLKHSCRPITSGCTPNRAQER